MSSEIERRAERKFWREYDVAQAEKAAVRPRSHCTVCGEYNDDACMPCACAEHYA